MSYKFDNLISDAKVVFDKVAVKTNEAVEYSKTQVERAQMRNKIRDKYYDLGRICYQMHESGNDETGSMKKIITEIEQLKADLKAADEVVSAKQPKACKFCGEKNDSGNLFCKKCGEKL